VLIGHRGKPARSGIRVALRLIGGSGDRFSYSVAQIPSGDDPLGAVPLPEPLHGPAGETAPDTELDLGCVPRGGALVVDTTL